MTEFTKYYLWSNPYDDYWKPQGSLHGYDTIEELKAQCAYEIERYHLVILEAKVVEEVGQDKVVSLTGTPRKRRRDA